MVERETTAIAVGRWNLAGALVGAVIWLALWLGPPLGQGIMDVIAHLLLLAMLVVVPLALPLLGFEPVDRTARTSLLVHKMHFPAALLAVASFLLSPGIVAALMALAWLLFTGLMAVYGVTRLSSRGRAQSLPALCVDASLLYIAVGGLWLVASRSGINLLGFREPIVLLTAVHFHYAGFAASFLAGLAGRWLVAQGRPLSKTYVVGALGAVLGTPVTAIGILASPMVEVVAVFVLAAGLLILSYLILTEIVPHFPTRLGQGLLSVSAVSLLVTMALAAAYAVGEFGQSVAVPIPRMVQIHGWINAVGFALCGFLAWTLVSTAETDRTAG